MCKELDITVRGLCECVCVCMCNHTCLCVSVCERQRKGKKTITRESRNRSLTKDESLLDPRSQMENDTISEDRQTDRWMDRQRVSRAYEGDGVAENLSDKFSLHIHLSTTVWTKS